MAIFQGSPQSKKTKGQKQKKWKNLEKKETDVELGANEAALVLISENFNESFFVQQGKKWDESATPQNLLEVKRRSVGDEKSVVKEGHSINSTNSPQGVENIPQEVRAPPSAKELIQTNKIVEEAGVKDVEKRLTSMNDVQVDEFKLKPLLGEHNDFLSDRQDLTNQFIDEKEVKTDANAKIPLGASEQINSEISNDEEIANSPNSLVEILRLTPDVNLEAPLKSIFMVGIRCFHAVINKNRLKLEVDIKTDSKVESGSMLSNQRNMFI